MGISQSLYTGVTGLATQSDGMSVIANNIANANAKGFKRDRAEFEDMLSTDMATGGGAAQIGRGARMRDVRTMHTQGGLQVTDNLTDLAIQGQGFFVLGNANTEVQESAGKFYTRVGSFIFDKDGFLADPSGGRVQGFMTNKSGMLTTKLEDFKIDTNAIPPTATGNVKLDLNLDARAKFIEGEFDVNNPDLTSNFSNGITVFDSQGRSHQMTVYFKKGEESTDGQQWTWFATVDGKEVTDSSGPIHQIGSGTLRFDNLGNLMEQEAEDTEVNFAGGALPGQRLKFDFGKILTDEGFGKGGSTTAIASKSVTNFHSQDGFESGNIKSIRIELDGSVRGIYTNGIQRHLGTLAMATFENQDGLLKAGRNLFYSTMDSGPPKIGVPQSGTRGSIYASTLEESNVDLAGEFVNMILTQRAFQANSRSITTTDTMIEEVINLKR